MLNELAYPYYLDVSISNFRGFRWNFSFCPNSKSTSCRQTVKILIRHCNMRCLIWTCTVCLCPIKRMFIFHHDCIFSSRIYDILSDVLEKTVISTIIPEGQMNHTEHIHLLPSAFIQVGGVFSARLTGVALANGKQCLS